LLARETDALLGVYSLLGGESCLGAEARHLFAHLPLFPLLTDQAFEAAGAVPTPEPVVTPSGEGGATVDGNAGDSGTNAAGAGSSEGGTGGRAAGGEGGDAPPSRAGEGGTLANGGAPTSEAGSDSGAASGAAGTSRAPPRTVAPRRTKSSGCGMVPNPEHNGSVAWLFVGLFACRETARRRARLR
jgi:hypothetical protein